MAEYQSGDQYTPSTLWLIQDSSAEAAKQIPPRPPRGFETRGPAGPRRPRHGPIPHAHSEPAILFRLLLLRTKAAKNAPSAPTIPSTARPPAAKSPNACSPPPCRIHRANSTMPIPKPSAISPSTFWKEHQNSSRERNRRRVPPRRFTQPILTSRHPSSPPPADPKAHRIFETHVLASEQAIASFQEVQTYLKSRKAAAKPFFESYAKLVRSQTREPPAKKTPMRRILLGDQTSRRREQNPQTTRNPRRRPIPARPRRPNRQRQTRRRRKRHQIPHHPARRRLTHQTSLHPPRRRERRHSRGHPRPFPQRHILDPLAGR